VSYLLYGAAKTIPNVVKDVSLLVQLQKSTYAKPLASRSSLSQLPSATNFFSLLRQHIPRHPPTRSI
jgi:hypothetical protein